MLLFKFFSAAPQKKGSITEYEDNQRIFSFVDVFAAEVIIIIIIYSLEFFTSALADGPALEIE